MSLNYYYTISMLIRYNIKFEILLSRSCNQSNSNIFLKSILEIFKGEGKKADGLDMIDDQIN